MPSSDWKGEAFTKMRKALPPAQGALLHVLVYRRGRDVPIRNLYAKLENDNPPHRYQQQRVGAILSKLNDKLAPHNLVVRPGAKRRTYRLCTIASE